MTNHAKDNDAPLNEPTEEQDIVMPAAGDGEAVSEEDVLLRLAKENEELKDRALRIAAEMENLRKRTARDVVEARSYSIAGFARDMLTVSDNLRRALDAVPSDAQASGDAGLVALVEGVEMTERSMLSTLERHGVKQIDPQGERFDPHFHQAMFEVPDPSVPESTVVQVVQRGYVIGERVLRPAMVGVAKGGPKMAAVKNGEATAEPGPPNPQAERDA
ncbi:nucleotide exchange factor GrpE [Nitratireductor pacificus]|uniref:Protein GrpE n=1 Tax=Nitratireductor pacificus pht-3B TaxID=391937 RepID=K2MCW9_9HYPH|nr:nucleotide exchange factor GrpE [Nitratireductor pacificus]EKF20046.1 heat shock protein GrpE [Nitratireductor pacificus pht-3B]